MFYSFLGFNIQNLLYKWTKEERKKTENSDYMQYISLMSKYYGKAKAMYSINSCYFVEKWRSSVISDFLVQAACQLQLRHND